MTTGGFRTLDRIRADLSARYPEWRVWYVPGQGRSIIWCARPHPLLNEDSPEDLTAAIERAVKERGLPG